MQDKFLFQNYLVVFFDNLGQRETLRKINGIPTNESENQKFIETTKESIGRVLNIRDIFKNYFDDSNQYVPNVNLVPPELREEFLASQKFNVRFYGISDTIIIAVPLMNNDENCTAINGIYHSFVVICGIGLLLLSMQVAMRAGLTVGVATQIDDNEIYGPALESAFYLESKLAEYPRFLVGEELISYLLWVETQSCSTRIGLVAKNLATYCKSMIIQDTDGRFMLDFLGDKIKEASENIIDQKVVSSALEFVTSQYIKHSKDKNDKLASRYYRLLRYFHSRKGIWGLN